MNKPTTRKTIAVRDARIQALKASGMQLPKDRLITEQFLAAKEARVRWKPSPL